MSVRVKKIIMDVDYGATHGSITFDRDELIDVHEIVDGTKPSPYLNEAREIEFPLFHGGGGATIVRDIGPHGVYYLFMRSGFYLSKLITEPEDTFVDLTVSGESILYCFYNGTRRSCISIAAVASEDVEGIADKLSEKLDDPVWRQYILRRTLERGGGIRGDSIESFPEILTAAQVGNLLSIGEKTVRNWTSEGRIPYKKIGGTTRYKKTEIMAAFESGQIGNLTKWKTRSRRQPG